MPWTTRLCSLCLLGFVACSGPSHDDGRGLGSSPDRERPSSEGGGRVIEDTIPPLATAAALRNHLAYQLTADVVSDHPAPRGTGGPALILNATLTNHGDRRVEVRHGGCPVGGIEIRLPSDPDGPPVWAWPGETCEDIENVLVVAPGQAVTSPLMERRISVPWILGDSIPPGQYLISARFTLHATPEGPAGPWVTETFLIQAGSAHLGRSP
jgi:hypothetical protein